MLRRVEPPYFYMEFAYHSCELQLRAACRQRAACCAARRRPRAPNEATIDLTVMLQLRR